MENRRMVLVGLLGLVLFLIYNAWQHDYGQLPAPAPATPAAAAASPDAKAAAAGATDVSSGVALTTQHLRVQTDLLLADIALAGGELRKLELSQYAADKKHPEQKLALLDDNGAQKFTLQSGLASTDDKPWSSSQTSFTSAQAEYRLADGADNLDVPMEYADASGYVVRKVFHFHRGSYEIGLTQSLANKTGHEIQASSYARYLRSPPPPDNNPGFMRTAGTFFGVGLYQQKDAGGSYSYHKTAFKDLDKQDLESKQPGGWVVMLQHYFLAGIVPPQDVPVTLTAAKLSKGRYEGLYQAQALTAPKAVADGAEQAFEDKLYIGPVLQGKMEAVTPGFNLVEDFGVLKSVAAPLFWVMTQYHKFTGNWGWSIILLTLTVKALFFKLSEAQFRSAAKMKKFGPRIAELRERFGDDRERLNKAMMDLYKKEKFNPLAGCWPLLVQMPVFLALYWVLAQSVELRQAPFVLWIDDLAAPDPYYILPVLYGISMWVQQRLSGQSATMDPTQQKVMNIMPIFLTGLFLFFPSGLVVYWLVNNLIGIGQQQFISRRLEREEQRKKDTAAVKEALKSEAKETRKKEEVKK